MKQPNKTQKSSLKKHEKHAQQITPVKPSEKASASRKIFPAFSEEISSIKDSSELVVMEGLRQKVFLDRYALKAKSGELIEHTPEEMWRRVAWGIAQAEKPVLRKVWEQRFYEVMKDFKFVPGGRILSGAGTGYEVTYFNCFVIPSPKDSREGILESLKQLVEIQSRSGGVGLNLSSLRPKGARVKKVNGFSSGPVTWAGLFSYATHDVVQQGGCFAPDTLIMTHLGLVPIKDIIDQKRDWYAATHQGYQKITSKFDNGVKKVYEVKTAAGYSLKVTSEHKFLTANSDGHFYQKRLADFKIGDCVTLHLGDWRQDIPYSPLNSFIPAPSKFSYGRRKIDLPKILDEKLAFLTGVYDADGSKIRDEFSPNGKGLKIAVAANRLKDLQKITDTIKEVFGVEAVVSQGDGAVYNVCVYSREINEFLKLNGLLKEYSVNVFVPNLILSSPRSVVEAYLAGVFLGDGGNRGGKGGFRISTVSKEYAKQLQLLLLNLGVAAKINTEDRAEKGWSTLYTVTVNGHRFMKRFYEIIAPFNEKAFDHPISKRDATFNWPFNLTEKFIYLSGFQRTIARTNITTSQKAVAFLETNVSSIHEGDRDDIAVLVTSVSDKISSIELIGEQNVYDLEVDKVHLLSGNGIYTSNSRRGATMLMLWDWHPDIEEFITVKQDLSKINGANLSVCVSDSFMETVKKDGDWDLVYPDLDDPRYDSHWNGELDEWKAMGGKVKVYKTIRAKALWDLICEAAWRSAEPGLHFLERSNRRSNTHYFEKLSATNPCLTGDTWVHTSKGPKQINDLIGVPFLARVNGKDYLSGFEGFFKTGTKKVIKLSTFEGYNLRLTPNHLIQRLISDKLKDVQIEWCEAGKLKPNDQIIINNHRQNHYWQGQFNYNEGYLLGLLVGDGTLKMDKAVLSVWNSPIKTGSMLTYKTGPQSVMQHALDSAYSMPHRADFKGWMHLPQRYEYRLSLSYIKALAHKLGMYPGRKTITPEVEKTSSDFYIGFLRGLFDSDGSVQRGTQGRINVRLAQSNLPLLEAAQRMLLRLGIASRIYQNRRIAGKALLPDGKGGYKEYPTKAQHELVISRDNLDIFNEIVGFVNSDKSSFLTRLLKTHNKVGRWKEKFVAVVKNLEIEAKEDVFDVQIPGINAFDANGIIAHNCGEQPLGPWAVCNLGAMNLSAYVENEQFDFEQFGQDVKVAMRLLDNVIDQTYYFFPQNEQCAKDIRRTGLGIMGLADALIKMKVRYGAKESLPIVRQIFQTLRDNAYIASSDIAKEKGSFPKFDKAKYLKGYHIQQLPEEIQEKIGKQGIRNAVLLTIAPTGTTSLVSGVSSGVEPVYEFSFLRRWRGGEEIVYHPLFDAWRKDHPDEPKPDYFVGANDLTPLEHVEVQAVAQEYIDSSISKTVNAPNSHTVDDVQTLYMAAYDMGLKGITYMRDGSRQGVLERVPEKKAEASIEPVVPKPIHRPSLLQGRTYKVNTPLGEGFITINRDENSQPYEVFITVAKGGSHTMADAEAIGRLISMTLRYSGDNRKEIAQKIVSQLRGIGGSSHIGFGKERVTSLADAVAKVLDQDLHLNELEKSAQQPLLESNSTTNGLANGQAKLNLEEALATPTEEVTQPQLVLESTQKSGDLCPECGNSTFVFEEGCQKCYSCGYSKC